MPDFLQNVQAWLATPLGQIALSVGAFLIAKRFPAFQSMTWFILDALKIPRPNVPTPGPAPSPSPSPVPGPSPGPSPSPGPLPEVGGLLSQLLAVLLAKRQHNAAADLIALAQRIEENNAEPVAAKGDA